MFSVVTPFFLVRFFGVVWVALAALAVALAVFAAALASAAAAFEATLASYSSASDGQAARIR